MIDAETHDVVVAEVSLVNVANNEVLPTMLNPHRPKLKPVSSDGAYGTKECHKLLRRKGEKPIILPLANAEDREDNHPRNETIKTLKYRDLKQ